MSSQTIKDMINENKGILYIFLGVVIVLLTRIERISTPIGLIKLDNILVNGLLLLIAIILVLFGFLEIKKLFNKTPNIKDIKNLYLQKMSNGSIYDNRFLIKAYMGRSSFADIYLVLDQNNKNKEVILKLFKYVKQSKSRQQHIDNEANFSQKLIALNLDGLINIYEVTWLNNKRVLRVVMEYMTGGNLEDFLYNQGNIKEKKVLEIILSLCETVEQLHTHNIIHCDIKPSNILLKPNLKSPILIDFGTAKYIGQYISLKSSYISIPYTAPETLKNSIKIDKTLDSYALGVVLLDLLTSLNGNKKKKNFDSITNPISLLSRKDLKEYNFDDKLLEISNLELRKIVQKSLSHSISYRYQTVTELKNSLLDFMKQDKDIIK